MKSLLQTLFAALAAWASPKTIVLATTSTQDSGLLDLLVPMFEKKISFGVDRFGAALFFPDTGKKPETRGL